MDGGMKARVAPTGMRYRSPSVQVASQANIMMKATSVSCSRRMRWGEGCVGLGVKRRQWGHHPGTQARLQRRPARCSADALSEPPMALMRWDT